MKQQLLIFCTLYFLVLVSHAEVDSKQSDSEQEGELLEIPLVNISCSLEGNSPLNYEVKVADVVLFNLKLSNCSVVNLNQDNFDVLLDVEFRLNLDADVSQCQSFNTAFLVKTRESSDLLDWGGDIKLVKDLPISNIIGDRSNINSFSIYSEFDSKRKTIRQNWLGDAGRPSFQEIYTAQMSILNSSQAKELADEVYVLTPIIGKKNVVDLDVNLVVETYPPQGYCVPPPSKDPKDKGVSPIPLSFSTK